MSIHNWEFLALQWRFMLNQTNALDLRFPFSGGEDQFERFHGPGVCFNFTQVDAKNVFLSVEANRRVY